MPGARAGNQSASFGIKGRKTRKIFGPGLDFRIQEAYITRVAAGDAAAARKKKG